MATEAAWLNGNRLTERRKRKCALTSTGLLMEGLMAGDTARHEQIEVQICLSRPFFAVLVLTAGDVLGLILVRTPMPNRRNFTILAKSLFALALLGNASGSLTQMQSGRSTHDISTQDKKRLEHFEKQVDDLRARLKIPGLSAVVL